MIPLDLFFLPAILIFGIITSYEDIKYGKIRNKYILFAFFYSILAYFIVLISYKALNIPLNYSYFADLIINLLFAVVAGFLFWNFKLWSAADGKLFIAYAVLIPLTFYSNFYTNYFPSLALLINSFIPYILFSFFLFLVKSRVIWKELRKTKKVEFLMLFLSFFWIKWALSFVMGFFKVNFDLFVYLLIIMALSRGINFLFNKKI